MRSLQRTWFSSLDLRSLWRMETSKLGNFGLGPPSQKVWRWSIPSFFILSSAVGQKRPRREGDRSCPRAGGRMKRETSCAPSKFGYLGVQIYLTLPSTPPPNIASNRRLEEGDPILARMDTYTGRICVEAVARATQGAGEEKF